MSASGTHYERQFLFEDLVCDDRTTPKAADFVFSPFNHFRPLGVRFLQALDRARPALLSEGFEALGPLLRGRSRTADNDKTSHHPLGSRTNLHTAGSARAVRLSDAKC